MKVKDFFRRNPVFRHEAFAAFLEASGPRSTKTREALLANPRIEFALIEYSQPIPALRRQMDGEGRVMLVDDPMEKGLFGPVAPVTDSA